METSDGEKRPSEANQKPLTVENLTKDESKIYIYKQANRIQFLENELNQRNNPVQFLSENFDKLTSLIEDITNRRLQFKKTSFKFSTTMSLIALIIVLIIVGSAGWLTYLEKIDGSTFTFLLGLVVGYALTFIQSLANPPE